ncbi:MAG: hypothetical protein FWH53_00755 [Leptospirales bacterium]|nr:hypothetical protein [Leptospirales bacterium]
MKKVITSFIIGLLAGSASVYYFFSHQDVQNSDTVTTRQISGEKITHDNFNFGGSNISFTTISDGIGEIETDIPKSLIPEAYNWMNRVHSLSVSFGYKFDNEASLYYGIMYGYRIGRVTVGGGIDFANDFFGTKVSVGYVW